MCLNQGALSCSGTHFIKPSSWGRGSVRPHIYHTNPSGLSPPCIDSMCVIRACPPDQATHWLPALIHFQFHHPFSVLSFLICYSPSSPSLSVFLWCYPFPFHSPFVLHLSLSQFFVVVVFFSLFFQGWEADVAQLWLDSEPCCVSFHSPMSISLSQWCKRYPDFFSSKQRNAMLNSCYKTKANKLY